MSDKRQSKDNISNRQKDYVTNKILLVFTIAFAMLLLLMNVGRMMKSTATYVSAHIMIKCVAVGALVLAAVGIAMMIYDAVKKRDKRYVLLSGKNITAAALFIAVCTGTLSFAFLPDTLLLLYVFVPAVIVLYIIYYSYQREFFMIALAAGIGASGVWLLSSDLASSFRMAIIGAVAIVMVLLCAFTVWAQRGKGRIHLFSREFVAFKSGAQYGLVYITFALVAALLAAAVIFPNMAIYFMFGLIGYIVFTGVYYTVKLI